MPTIGQGMSFDYYSGTIYLSAFNNTTFTGQLRTMDPLTGMTTLITDWGYEQIAPFSLLGFPCTQFHYDHPQIQILHQVPQIFQLPVLL